ncbi:DNA polymerase III subunit beta [Fictibacillus sp. 18YEL24]|uniref:DNA polymerase III subunit beta n=1 Tax=Fictibacillus sp. 18YEL24 TaxID=2745875 RepID=UPI0018CFE2F9|nr:DNA polymerase III subunit beta [Fictibacillus sp. 18YEL24]MBH0170131.1 DNA polymerase III subunit beta [Fictibacillus sp. 18YEL24]
MKFSIDQKLFSKALSDVGRAVSQKSLVPILSGIKVIAEDEGITLIGTNADIIIKRLISKDKTSRNISIDQAGSAVVSERYFTELIRKLPEDVHIEGDDKTVVKVRSGNIFTQLNAFRSDEYPQLPEIDQTKSIGMDANELKETIKQTVFATAKNETRPVLTGVHFTFSNNKLTAVATNSQRLASRINEVHVKEETSFIVPSSSLNELVKQISDYSGIVKMYSADGYILFETDEISLYSRLISGQYPNTSKLIPNEQKTVLSLNKERFVKGIERACLFAGEWKNNNIMLSIKDHKLCISSGSSEMGSIQELQEIKDLSGDEDLKISIDGYFLKEALHTIMDEEINIKFNGSMRPIVIESTHQKSSYLHLISPVRSF